MNEHEKAVAVCLEAAGVTFAASLVGETSRDGGDGKPWVCDEWRTRFTRRAQSGGKAVEMGHPFYTGTGHRVALKHAPKAPSNSRSMAYEQWAAQWVKPVAPTAAGVLYSLLSDAQSAEQNLHDWCADFGLDPDSRKACATYDACCLILADVRRFFTREERDALAQLLQDY